MNVFLVFGALLLVAGASAQSGLGVARAWGWQAAVWGRDVGKDARRLDKAHQSRASRVLRGLLAGFRPPAAWGTARTGDIMRRRLRVLGMPEHEIRHIERSVTEQWAWALVTVGSGIAFVGAVFDVADAFENSSRLPAAVGLSLAGLTLALWWGDRGTRSARESYERRARRTFRKAERVVHPATIRIARELGAQAERDNRQEPAYITKRAQLPLPGEAPGSHDPGAPGAA